MPLSLQRDPNLTAPLLGVVGPGYEKMGLFETPGGNLELRNKAGANLLGGSGSASAAVSGAFPDSTNGQSFYAPFSRSGTLGSLYVWGNPGTLTLFFVTKAQYLANPNTAAGTSIGAITLSADGQQTSSLTQAVSEGDYLRVVPSGIASGKTLNLVGKVS